MNVFFAMQIGLIRYAYHASVSMGCTVRMLGYIHRSGKSSVNHRVNLEWDKNWDYINKC